jgi:hypothetical protein
MPRCLSREIDERTAGSSAPTAAISRISEATLSQPPESLA